MCFSGIGPCLFLYPPYSSSLPVIFFPLSRRVMRSCAGTRCAAAPASQILPRWVRGDCEKWIVVGKWIVVPPQHRGCSNFEIVLPFRSVIRYTQPWWKLVVVDVFFDILNGQSRVFFVKLPFGDEVSYYPAVGFAVVIKVHKAISDYSWATYNYAVVVFAPMVPITLIYKHYSYLRF